MVAPRVRSKTLLSVTNHSCEASPECRLSLYQSSSTIIGEDMSDEDIVRPSDTTIDIRGLQEWRPYPAKIADMEIVTGSEQYGSKERLQIDFELQLPEGETRNVRSWFGISLGKSNTGQIAKLRRLLNAITNRKSTDEISWFNKRTLEWGITDNVKKPLAKLNTDTMVTVRGKIENERYSIQEFAYYDDEVPF